MNASSASFERLHFLVNYCQNLRNEYGQIENEENSALLALSLESFEKELVNVFQNEYLFSIAVNASDLVLHYESDYPTSELFRISRLKSVISNLDNIYSHLFQSYILDFGGKADLKRYSPEITIITQGSLIIGVKVSPVIKKPDEFSLLDMHDPVYTSTRSALNELTRMAGCIKEKGLGKELESEFADPKKYDSLLVAASKISPSQKSIFKSVSLLGDKSDTTLDKEIRKEVTKYISKPYMTGKAGTLSGIVRAVDLDSHRMTMKSANGQATRIILKKKELTATKATKVLDRQVTVSGTIIRDNEGNPKVIYADSVS